MEQLFDIAGTIIRVCGADSDMSNQLGQLAAFTTESDTWDWEIHFRIVDAFPEPRGECVFIDSGRRVYKDGEVYISYIGSVENDLRNTHIWKKRENKEGTALIKRSAVVNRIHSKTILTAMEIEHLVVANNGFLLHASCICNNGQAIAFTGLSGIGKSTQAALWERLRGAEVINGDRIVIQRSNCGFDAVGIPFSGSSGICINRRIPLAAIVCLSQAQSTKIDAMTGIRAFRTIWEGCSLHTWDRDAVDRCSQSVQAAVNQVPIFHLACTPDESAVLALEDALERLK